MAVIGLQVLSVDELRQVLRFLDLRDIMRLHQVNKDQRKVLIVSGVSFYHLAHDCLRQYGGN